MQYTLMNRDEELLRFCCGKNDFDEIEAEELEWLTDLRPLGYRDLTSYLERRQAPKHRKHIEELLERYGCHDLEGFLQITHALSLNDTFWVKAEGSGLKWEDVSLYRNEFDELVSAAAFDGEFGSISLSSTSPEFGTDGYFAKCWMREEDGIYLYKGGSDTFGIEPLSEYLAGQLAEKICPDSVPYDMAFYHGKLISKCRLFTDEETGMVKAHDVLDRAHRNASQALRYFESIGSGDTFRRMCVLDALILNTDRHFGNFGVLIDNQTMQVRRMAPVFDNNRSLLFDMDSDQLKRTEWCIRTCRPRFGTDFITTARAVLTPEIREDLQNLRGFAFVQHPEISAEPERLERLTAVVQYQLERILK